MVISRGGDVALFFSPKWPSRGAVHQMAPPRAWARQGTSPGRGPEQVKSSELQAEWRDVLGLRSPSASPHSSPALAALPTAPLPHAAHHLLSRGHREPDHAAGAAQRRK